MGTRRFYQVGQDGFGEGEEKGGGDADVSNVVGVGVCVADMINFRRTSLF